MPPSLQAPRNHIRTDLSGATFFSSLLVRSRRHIDRVEAATGGRQSLTHNGHSYPKIKARSDHRAMQSCLPVVWARCRMILIGAHPSTNYREPP